MRWLVYGVMFVLVLTNAAIAQPAQTVDPYLVTTRAVHRSGAPSAYDHHRCDGAARDPAAGGHENHLGDLAGAGRSARVAWLPTEKAAPTTGDKGLTVLTDAAGTIFEIQSAYDPRSRTAEGIHVGSPGAEALAKLGTPDRVTTVGLEDYKIYEHLGLAVLIVNGRHSPTTVK